MSTLQKVETTPLVVDGVMYVPQPPNDVIALDPETGRQHWSHIAACPPKIDVCCGQVNRGLAMLGNRLYMDTVDAHLVALDAKTGKVIWDIEEADHAKGCRSSQCGKNSAVPSLWMSETWGKFVSTSPVQPGRLGPPCLIVGIHYALFDKTSPILPEVR